MTGPKRTSSEPTLVLDRARIISESARDAFEKSLKDDEPDTLEACPACQFCATCGGTHMVQRHKKEPR